MSYIMSTTRARLLALLAGLIGALVVAAAIYFYVSATKPSIDGLSFFLGSFFACSIGVFAGALIANFLVGVASRGPDVTSYEY
jgi:hypothetical protein